MVFKHDGSKIALLRFQHLPHHLRVLVRDGDVWADINDAIHIPTSCMVQRKTQACQCLTPTRWHGKGEDPLGPLRCCQAVTRISCSGAD